METLHLSDDEVTADHLQLLTEQTELDARVMAGNARAKALHAVYAKTMDPNSEGSVSAMASSIKRGIIEKRLSEVDRPVAEAEEHRRVAQEFNSTYGGQLHTQAKQEMDSGA